jgi:HAD superfamily hydrolase (TIGR01549 family)
LTIQQGLHNKIKAVIFDVDGTLYEQSKLRKLMLKEVLIHFALRPHKFRDLRIISTFRKLREINFAKPTDNLMEDEYLWTAEALGYDKQSVRRAVEEWIYNRPLKYMLDCRQTGLADFMGFLQSNNFKTGVFSDYPAQAKLDALNLTAQHVVCASDKDVNRLKPDPKGLQLICQRMGESPQSCLFIGDRMERDGECAEKLGMPYLILNKEKRPESHFFRNYTELLALFKETFDRK